MKVGLQPIAYRDMYDINIGQVTTLSFPHCIWTFYHIAYWSVKHFLKKTCIHGNYSYIIMKMVYIDKSNLGSR